MVIVVVSAKQGGGKTTLSNRLREKIEERGKYPFFNLKFAETIYKMHDLIRGVLKECNYENYDYSKKDGRLLQLLGTEWGRGMDEQIWVSLLHGQIKNLPKDAIVAVDDCRFENEFDSFNNMPGVLKVRIEASRQTRKFRCTSTPGSVWRDDESHPSETGLDHYAAMGKFDLVLDSDRLSADDVFRYVMERTDILIQNRNVNMHGI